MSSLRASRTAASSVDELGYRLGQGARVPAARGGVGAPALDQSPAQLGCERLGVVVQRGPTP